MSGDEYTLIHLDSAARDLLIVRGSVLAVSSFWTTTLEQFQLPKLARRINWIDCPPSQVSLVRFDREILLVQKLFKYRDNGSWKIIGKAAPQFVHGLHFRLVMGFASEDHVRKDADRLIRRYITELRFTCGQGAAVNEVYRVEEDLLSAQRTHFSPYILVEDFLVGEDFLETWDPMTQDFQLGQMYFPEEAVILIDKALQSPSIEDRFILLWFALERLIGNGPRVKQYFQKTCRSKTLADAATVLSRIRGAYAHKGKGAATMGHITTLLEMIRIVSLIDDAQRVRMVKKLEARLNQQKA